MATREAVSTWFGAFVVEDGIVRERYPSPLGASELAERIARRREGQLTPEETRLLEEHPPGALITGDRRLAAHGIPWDRKARATVDPRSVERDLMVLRDATLREAERALAASWDPSIHVTEAVRALGEVERAQNLLGERLGSWTSRDSPELDPGDARRAAAEVLGPETGTDRLDHPEPGLDGARRSLAEAYRVLGEAREKLEDALRANSAARTPNLAHLLGPDLAARMVAQGGSLERLSRLPASTIQVLGAERAFFEHLRGKAPPPRHGLLFLHAKVQSAPRSARGRLARALAGKVAIAARLDQAGSPLDPRLLNQFEARAEAIRLGTSRHPHR